MLYSCLVFTKYLAVLLSIICRSWLPNLNSHHAAWQCWCEVLVYSTRVDCDFYFYTDLKFAVELCVSLCLFVFTVYRKRLAIFYGVIVIPPAILWAQVQPQLKSWPEAMCFWACLPVCACVCTGWVKKVSCCTVIDISKARQ